MIESAPSGPNSNTAEIAAAKIAAIVMTSDMGAFVGNKIKTINGGKPALLCPQTAGVVEVPVVASCRSNTHLGGVFSARMAGASQGVEITIVYASHANNVAPALLSPAHDPVAPERGGDRRRQTAPGLARGGACQTAQGRDTPSGPERAFHGV